MRGNVVDLAIGVVIGSAFGKIISSIVADIIMPIVTVTTGKTDFFQWKTVLREGFESTDMVVINWGNFVQSMIDFVIIAFCIFIVIKFINALKKKEEAKEEQVEDTKTEKLLAEIRDLMKK